MEGAMTEDCPKPGARPGHFVQERQSVIFKDADGQLYRIVECRKCEQQRKGRKITDVLTVLREA